jgi:hypothetical protein
MEIPHGEYRIAYMQKHSAQERGREGRGGEGREREREGERETDRIGWNKGATGALDCWSALLLVVCFPRGREALR